MSLELRGAVAVLIDSGTEVDGDVTVPAPPTRTGGRQAGTGGGQAGSLDVSGCVVTPGLINAHHHLLQTAFRTLPGTRGVPMREWLGLMAGAYARGGHDSELYGLAASVGAAEGLLCGVTTIADHHLNWPKEASVDATVELAGATVAGALGVGGRLVFVRGSAGDDADWAAASAEAIHAALIGTGASFGADSDSGTRSDSDSGSGSDSDSGSGSDSGTRSDSRTRSDGRSGPVGGVVDGGRLQMAVGPAGVHSDGRATFEALGDVAARHGLVRRTQANEQVDTAIALERYGARPIELLEQWGWLGPDVTLAHLCDVTESEIEQLAAAGVSATHAPGCDVPMGWGIAPVQRLLNAGIAVGLGTSGGGSNDAGHLLADARLAMQISGLLAPRTGEVAPQLPARTVLAMATAGSAAGLGRPELGHLGPHSAGDLCAWDVSGVADAGIADPVAGLLWGSPGRRPRHVVVGGRVVVRDYRLVDMDEAELVIRLRERLARTPVS